jgi:phosphatidylglycerophosphate synthase
MSKLLITPNSLNNLRNKSFKGSRLIDKDILSYYFFVPISKKIINYFPECIHPNIITFCGGISPIIGIILISLFLNKISNSFSLMDIIISISVLLFEFFDCLDGLQARKTKKASILGEFVDHTTDSIAIPLTFSILGYILDFPKYFWIVVLISTIFEFFELWMNAITEIVLLDYFGEPTIIFLITLLGIFKYLNLFSILNILIKENIKHYFDINIPFEIRYIIMIACVIILVVSIYQYTIGVFNPDYEIENSQKIATPSNNNLIQDIQKKPFQYSTDKKYVYFCFFYLLIVTILLSIIGYFFGENHLFIYSFIATFSVSTIANTVALECITRCNENVAFPLIVILLPLIFLIISIFENFYSFIFLVIIEILSIIDFIFIFGSRIYLVSDALNVKVF